MRTKLTLAFMLGLSIGLGLLGLRLCVWVLPLSEATRAIGLTHALPLLLLGGFGGLWSSYQLFFARPNHQFYGGL